MSKSKTNNSRYNEHSCLCQEHATAFNVKPEYVAKNLNELGEDEVIECDACNMIVMRRSGVL